MCPGLLRVEVSERGSFFLLVFVFGFYVNRAFGNRKAPDLGVYGGVYEEPLQEAMRVQVEPQ